MNIVEPVLYQCKFNPFATAIATPGSGINSIKYGQLEELIHNVARSAIKAGLAPGDIAAIFVHDAIVNAALILGLMRIGVVTVALGEASVPEGLPVDVILTNAPHRFPDTGKVIKVSAVWLQGEGTALDYERIYRDNENDDCCIILTSGSTGRRKGVAFTHKMLADRLTHYRVLGPLFARISRIYSGFGIASNPGMRLFMYMLSYGGAVYYAGQEPDAILQYLDGYKIEGFACSPQQLEGLLKLFEADGRLTCNFNLVMCAGARLSPQLSARARAHLCQNIYTSYGSTETTTVACGPAQLETRTPGAVGFICPGVSVDILDGDDRPMPTGREGRIRIRSLHVARGYVGDPEATAQMFRDGAFYSGDLGYVTPDGLLVLTGREKTTLLVGGDSIAPEIIEEALSSYTGIEQAAVCTLDNAMGVAEVHALIMSKSDIDEVALLTHCQGQMRPSLIPVRFHRVDAIPRAGQGKIDRPRVLEIAKVKAKTGTG